MGFVLAGMTIFSFGSLRTPQSALRMIRMETIGFSVFLAAYGVLWLSTGFGKGYTPSKKDKVVLLANIRWRISSKPSM